MDAPRSSVPWLEKPAQPYSGPFRNNVLAFLKTHAISKLPLQNQGLRKVTAYVLRLVHQTKDGSQQQTLLHVYEERVAEDGSAICDQCRNMGWQHHPVCNRKYHFIIPGHAVLAAPNQLPAKVEALVLCQDRSCSVASLNLSQLSIEADENTTPYNAPATVFDSTLHCLHGVLHGNGYGHLLRINGRDGACGPLSGTQLVSVWDALCSLLGAQHVSVEDVSNKSGMLLRVLHGAAHLKTWYGKWGYEFGRACYNHRHDEYLTALHEVHQAPVADIIQDCASVNQELCDILQHYATEPAVAKQPQLQQQRSSCMLQLEATPLPAAVNGCETVNGHREQPQHTPAQASAALDMPDNCKAGATTTEVEAGNGAQTCAGVQAAASTACAATGEQQLPSTAGAAEGVSDFKMQHQVNQDNRTAAGSLMHSRQEQTQGDACEARAFKTGDVQQPASTEVDGAHDGAMDVLQQDLEATLMVKQQEAAAEAGTTPGSCAVPAAVTPSLQARRHAAGDTSNMDAVPAASPVAEDGQQPGTHVQQQMLHKAPGPVRHEAKAELTSQQGLPAQLDSLGITATNQPQPDHTQLAALIDDPVQATSLAPQRQVEDSSKAAPARTVRTGCTAVMMTEEGQSAPPDLQAVTPLATHAGHTTAVPSTHGTELQVARNGSSQHTQQSTTSAVGSTTLGQVLQRMLKQLAMLPQPPPPPLVQPVLPSGLLQTPCAEAVPELPKAVRSKTGKVSKTANKRTLSARSDTRPDSQQLFTTPAVGMTLRDMSIRMTAGSLSTGVDLEIPGSEDGTAHLASLRTSRRATRGRRLPPPPDVADLPAQQLQGSSTVPVHASRGASKRLSSSGAEHLLAYMQRSHAAAHAGNSAGTPAADATGHAVAAPVDTAQNAGIEKTVDNAHLAISPSSPRRPARAVALSYTIGPDGSFVLPELKPPPEQLPPLRLRQLAACAGRHGSVDRLQRVLLVALQVLKVHANGCWVRRDVLMDAMGAAGYRSQGTVRDVLQLLCGHRLGGWAGYRVAGLGPKCQTQFRLEPACEQPLDLSKCTVEELFSFSDNPQAPDAPQPQPAAATEQQPAAAADAAVLCMASNEQMQAQGQQQQDGEFASALPISAVHQPTASDNRPQDAEPGADPQQQHTVDRQLASAGKQDPTASQLSAAVPAATGKQTPAEAAATAAPHKAASRGLPKPDPTSLFEAAVAAATAESLTHPAGRPARQVARATARALLDMRSGHRSTGGGAGNEQAHSANTSSTQHSKKRSRKSTSVEPVTSPSDVTLVTAVPCHQQQGDCMPDMLVDKQASGPATEPAEPQPVGVSLVQPPLPHSPLKRQRSKQPHTPSRPSSNSGNLMEWVAVGLETQADGHVAVSLRVQPAPLSAARQNLLQLLLATSQPMQGQKASGTQQAQQQQQQEPPEQLHRHDLTENKQGVGAEMSAPAQLSDNQAAEGTTSTVVNEAALLALSEVTGKLGAEAAAGAAQAADAPLPLLAQEAEGQHTVHPGHGQQGNVQQAGPQASEPPCLVLPPLHNAGHFEPDNVLPAAELSALGGGPLLWGCHDSRSPRKVHPVAQGSVQMVSGMTAAADARTASAVSRPAMGVANGNGMHMDATVESGVHMDVGAPEKQPQHVHSHAACAAAEHGTGILHACAATDASPHPHPAVPAMLPTSPPHSYTSPIDQQPKLCPEQQTATHETGAVVGIASHPQEVASSLHVCPAQERPAWIEVAHSSPSTVCGANVLSGCSSGKTRECTLCPHMVLSLPLVVLAVTDVQDAVVPTPTVAAVEDTMAMTLPAPTVHDAQDRQHAEEMPPAAAAAATDVHVESLPEAEHAAGPESAVGVMETASPHSLQLSPSQTCNTSHAADHTSPAADQPELMEQPAAHQHQPVDQIAAPQEAAAAASESASPYLSGARTIPPDGDAMLLDALGDAIACGFVACPADVLPLVPDMQAATTAQQDETLAAAAMVKADSVLPQAAALPVVRQDVEPAQLAGPAPTAAVNRANAALDITLAGHQHSVQGSESSVLPPVQYQVGTASAAYKQVPAVAVQLAPMHQNKKPKLDTQRGIKPYLAPLIVMADVEPQLAISTSHVEDSTMPPPATATATAPPNAAAGVFLPVSKAARPKRKRDIAHQGSIGVAVHANAGAEVAIGEPLLKQPRTSAHEGSALLYGAAFQDAAAAAVPSHIPAATAAAPPAGTKLKIRVKGFGKQAAAVRQAQQQEQAMAEEQSVPGGETMEGKVAYGEKASLQQGHVPLQQTQVRFNKAQLKHAKLEQCLAAGSAAAVPAPAMQQGQRIVKQPKQAKQNPQKQQQQEVHVVNAQQHDAHVAPHTSRPARIRRPSAYAQDYILDDVDEPSAVQAMVTKPAPRAVPADVKPVMKEEPDAAAEAAAVRTSGRVKKPRRLSSSPEPPPVPAAAKSAGKSIKRKSGSSMGQAADAVHGHTSCNGSALVHHMLAKHAHASHPATKLAHSTASLRRRPRCTTLPLWYLSTALGRTSAHNDDAAHLDHAASIQDTSGALAAAASPGPGWRRPHRTDSLDLPAGPSATPAQAQPLALDSTYTRVLADLHCIYNNLLRQYQPVLAALQRAQLSSDADLATAQLVLDGTPLRLHKMAAHLQVLKDSRYFVKDYGGPLRHAPPPDTLRLMCQVQLPVSMVTVFPLPEDATRSAVQLRRHGITPAEPVMVPYRSSISDVRRLAADALSDVYRLFRPRAGVSEFHVTAILQGLPPALQELPSDALDHVRVVPASVASADSQSVEARVRPRSRAADTATTEAPPCDQAAAWTADDGAVVVMSATGMDPDTKWLHAGGAEDWQVYCNVCGTQDDDGERMIACDCCARWVHTRCYEIPEEADDPATFVCDLCWQK